MKIKKIVIALFVLNIFNLNCSDDARTDRMIKSMLEDHSHWGSNAKQNYCVNMTLAASLRSKIKDLARAADRDISTELSLIDPVNPETGKAETPMPTVVARLKSLKASLTGGYIATEEAIDNNTITRLIPQIKHNAIGTRLNISETINSIITSGKSTCDQLAELENLNISLISEPLTLGLDSHLEKLKEVLRSKALESDQMAEFEKFITEEIDKLNQYYAIALLEEKVASLL